jgi:hypothetical protein
MQDTGSEAARTVAVSRWRGQAWAAPQDHTPNTHKQEQPAQLTLT